MATFNKPIATNQGIALLKSEVAGTDSITFTKTVFSSDDYSQTADSDIANLTAIQSMDLTATAQAFQDVNGNTKVRAIGYNNSVNQAFYVKTYALYAKNKAGNEILFAVASSQTADFVPAFNNAQLTQIAYTFTFAIDQTQNITLSDQHEVTVTQADLAGINNYVNSNAISASSAIASNASSINSVQSSVTANSSAIASNASNVNSLSSSTSQYVNSLQSSISNNTSNIGNLQSSVTNNANDIKSSIKYIRNLNNSDNVFNVDALLNGIYEMVQCTAQNLPFPTFTGKFIKLGNGTGSPWNLFTLIAIDEIAGQSYVCYVNGWPYNYTGWHRIVTDADVNQINANITNVQNQVNSVNSNALMFKGDIPAGTQLSSITASGIYHLPNNNYPDAPSVFDSYSSGAQLIVINYGGFISQRLLINTQSDEHEVTRLIGGSNKGNWQAIMVNNV